MDIADLSMVLAQNNTMSQVSTALMSQALEQMDTNTQALTQMMEQSVHPELGTCVDVSV